MKRIILIDTNPAVRSSTKAIIDTMDSFDVIRDATESTDVYNLIKEIFPSKVIPNHHPQEILHKTLYRCPSYQ